MSSGNLTVSCPFCGRQSRMPPGIAGRTVRCPHCKKTWKISAESQQVPSSVKPGQPQQSNVADSTGTSAGTFPESILSDAMAETPVVRGFTAAPEPGLHPGAIAGTTSVNPAGAPASSIWWFVLGGLSVLVLLGVVAAVVVVLVLFLQRPQQVPQPQPPAAAVQPAPPAPNPEDDLMRKGAATAAFLEALFNESRKVLGDFSNISNMFAGGAPAPADLNRKLATWEQTLSQLDTKDVDPVAIQFKDRYVQEFKKYLNVIIKVSQNLNATLQSGNPEAVLNMAEQLGAAQNESLAATNAFFDFLNTEGQAVKKDLESRYKRDFPMPMLPR